MYTSHRGKASGKKVHVICGGGEGTDVLQALHDEGYQVTAGVLSVNDSDYRTAQSLGIPCIAEPPFSPVTERSLGELSLSLGDAGVVVLTRGLWGSGNIGNLRVLESVKTPGIVVFDPASGRNDEWDFSGGEAQAILERLKTGGAVIAKDLRSAMAAVAGVLGGGPCPA